MLHVRKTIPKLLLMLSTSSILDHSLSHTGDSGGLDSSLPPSPPSRYLASQKKKGGRYLHESHRPSFAPPVVETATAELASTFTSGNVVEIDSWRCTIVFRD